jgi:mono/diheme cytochrome c family protein
MKIVLFAGFTLLLSTLTFAQDINNGKHLHESKCYQCHADKSGLGDGNLIYTRADRKVKSLAKLKSQTSMCNSQLRLDLFPEDEADLVAFLNQQFYKFK